MSREELVRKYLGGQISRRVFIRRLVATGISTVAAFAYADLLPAAPAAALTDFYIVVFDYGFSPNPAQPVQQGRRVEWGFKNDNSHAHSATDSTSMGYFDTGFVPHNKAAFSTFVAAGGYPYKCKETTHVPMTGTINVPVKAKPASGHLSTTFTVTWASQTAPTGYRYDVQIKKPGAGSFADWKTGQTARQATFKPSKRGQHSFRARLRKLSGGASGYSDSKVISVN